MTDPSVLVTVGTDFHPFDRLVEWADRAHSDPELPRFFIQSGTSNPPLVAPYSAYLGFDELKELMTSVDAVVTHGGPATIIQIRQAGLVPIVVPRRRSHGEHVDDHQWRFAMRLADLKEIRMVEDEAGFISAIKEVSANPSVVKLQRNVGRHVEDAVREFERHVTELLRKRQTSG